VQLSDVIGPTTAVQMFVPSNSTPSGVRAKVERAGIGAALGRSFVAVLSPSIATRALALSKSALSRTVLR
jgi:hypothetical protein